MLVFARVFVIGDENVGPTGDAASRAAPVLHIEFQALSKIGSNLIYNRLKSPQIFGLDH